MDSNLFVLQARTHARTHAHTIRYVFSKKFENSLHLTSSRTVVLSQAFLFRVASNGKSLANADAARFLKLV